MNDQEIRYYLLGYITEEMKENWLDTDMNFPRDFTEK